MSLLEVNGLNSYYGDSHILFDVSLRVEKNEVVALLGRNGAGKSTTFKSLMCALASTEREDRREQDALLFHQVVIEERLEVAKRRAERARRGAERGVEPRKLPVQKRVVGA